MNKSKEKEYGKDATGSRVPKTKTKNKNKEFSNKYPKKFVQDNLNKNLYE